MKLKAFTKIAIINFALLSILILLAEFTYRFLGFAKSCSVQCDFSRFSIITRSQRNKWYMGVTRFDQNLGYEPNSNLDLIINEPGWHGNKVSTDLNGFRTSHPNPAAKFKILTVGDSFTWGTQVSNNDTWQSCLNISLQDFEVVNAGVFGYGTYQAFMRSKEIIKDNHFKYVILQTLVGEDFKRDQLDIRSGFVKPYLKKTNGTIVVSPPPIKSIPNTKYGPSNTAPTDYLLANLTFLRKLPKVSWLRTNAHDKINGNIYRRGINSASIEEIIDHTIISSNRQQIRFIWLLQYSSTLDENVLNERQYIIRGLSNKNIPYIDTFNVLHNSKKYTSDQLWYGHHTALGNKVVCDEIAKYFTSTSNKYQ